MVSIGILEIAISMWDGKSDDELQIFCRILPMNDIGERYVVLQRPLIYRKYSESPYLMLLPPDREHVDM